MVPAEPVVKEVELRPPVLAHLEHQGYRAWADPDGRDYFDIAALRDREVGLVELKVASARAVFVQALRRRAWAGWVAVALPSRRAARRLVWAPQPERARRVGVWVVERGKVDEMRAAAPLCAPGERDPFLESRERLRGLLTAMARGEVPDGVRWGFAGSPRLAGAHRRSTADWRLEEFP